MIIINYMKIGLLREGKMPPDKRVPFSPIQCRDIVKKYPTISIYIQPSSIRCFPDSEYKKNGVILTEDLSLCDVIMGVKEVPINMLIPNKLFFFFSHTIKKQPYNQELLKTIIQKKIQLVDYETLIDHNNNRIIGFGRYAGIVGCYNTFLAYGKKSKLYDLKFAHLLSDKKELEKELLKVKLPRTLKIILTGSGRVSNGAIEILDLLNIKKVSKKDFLTTQFDIPIYTQLLPSDYYERKDGNIGKKEDFYMNPNEYQSSLFKFCAHANILITGHYHAPNNPILLSKENINNKLFKIEVLGDISCDIAGPIASTVRPSTIEHPLYGYNKFSGLEDDYNKEANLVVMAVDNLPCSLPKDASIDFGKVFIEKVLPDLLHKREIIENGSITLNGQLTNRFTYLSDYIN